MRADFTLFDTLDGLTNVCSYVTRLCMLSQVLSTSSAAVGAHLYSKKGSRASAWALTWLFSYRYAILCSVFDLFDITR